MSLGIECLLCDDENLAMQMAEELDELNQERRRIQSEMQGQALEDLNLILANRENTECYGICLYNEQWHQGVVGILASKVKEQFHRPVIAFAPDKDNNIKGSARSVSGLHIKDVLEAIVAQNPGLIHKFGGHAMAAGLTMSLTHFDQFAELFDQEVKKILCKEQLNGEVMSDGELQADELSMQMAYLLDNAGPWGQSFPEPCFDGEFQVLKKRIVGDNHLKLDLKHDKNAKSINAIAFNTTDESWPQQVERVHAVYRLDINEYRGQKQLQLMIEHITPITI